jgi:proto-chlorophyllide reductase subunit
MKFLCVPCDSPMKLQTVGPPERGSLSIVYACPECGYEIAMLTNAYETQAVQSLGVRIGPETSAVEASADAGPSAAGRLRAEGASASLAEASAAAGCPFASMIPATEDAQRGQSADPTPVRWTAAAEARLANVPAFVRPMAKAGIERFARDNGCLEVDEKILEAAREFFGM